MMAKVALPYSMTPMNCSIHAVFASQEGLLVRTQGNGKQREPPTKGLAMAMAASVEENAADEGESSNDGIPNEYNNGSNDASELQWGSATNNGEGYDTLEDSFSEGEI